MAKQEDVADMTPNLVTKNRRKSQEISIKEILSNLDINEIFLRIKYNQFH